jgi:hypothetical protein
VIACRRLAVDVSLTCTASTDRATGVPFFVLDRRYGVSGGRPAEVFRRALEEAWRTRPQPPKLASIPGLGSDEIAQSGEVCGPDGTCAVPQR